MPADPSPIVQWAPAVSAAFAALAAGASWAAVRLNHKEWRASRTPELRGQLVRRQATGRLELVILNAGEGVARTVGFCVVVGGEYVAGFAGPNLGGFLQPGERATVVTELDFEAGPEVRGVVTCDDVAGNFHSWAIHPPRHRVWRRGVLRRPIKDYPSGEEVLRHHHAEIDLSELRRVGGHTRVERDSVPSEE